MVQLPSRKVWPQQSDGSFELAEIQTRAARPGELDMLRDRWGCSYTPVAAGENGEAVAALVTAGNLELLWQHLVLTFPEHGLWPVVTDLEEYRGDPLGVLREFLAGPAEITEDAEAFFRRRYSDPDFRTYAVPHPPFTHLARFTTSGTRHRLAPADVPANYGLLVVPTTRPADIPAALGWLGGTNYDILGPDISAVLRSWEDRFGAVLMQLNPDFLTLQVPHPPTDPGEQVQAALEHYLFCPDNIEQGTQTFENYVPAIPALAWAFWWD